MWLQTWFGLACIAASVTALTSADLTVQRRAPAMGFMGMRGKKDAVPNDKRAPDMGFMGMRGKKEPLSDLTQDTYLDDKRAMGFVGMRGRKLYDSEYDDDFSIAKRVPAMGFQGVRGKKDDFYYKRAPAMGFMGMRGKKDDYSDIDDYTEDYLWSLDKRAPASGFFGMRGKKGPSGFFGMRGKKGPSGFFGMRGKKGPISGFMGVRGKKDSSDDLQALLSMLNERQSEDRTKRAPENTASRFIESAGRQENEGLPEP